jgi:hypothetical protein
MANTNFQFKRVATKAQDFSMSKDHTPPETKTNKTTSPQTKANQPSAKLNQRRQLPLKWRPNVLSNELRQTSI